jgi:hypothetical protein
MGTHSQAISVVLLRLKCLFFQRLRVRADCALASVTVALRLAPASRTR